MSCFYFLSFAGEGFEMSVNHLGQRDSPSGKMKNLLDVPLLLQILDISENFLQLELNNNSL